MKKFYNTSNFFYPKKNKIRRKFSPRKRTRWYDKIKPDCIITLKRTPSNMIMTLMDSSGNVLKTASSGTINMKGGRKKISIVSLEILTRHVIYYMKSKGLNNVNLIFYFFVYSAVSLIIELLLRFKIRIHKIIDRALPAHNGIRHPQPKRL